MYGKVIMGYDYNKHLKNYSQELRVNMTKEERKLWYDFLRKLPLHIKRQKIIGDYIVDFYCTETHTVIEIDGSQHFELDGLEKDAERDKYLSSLGISVLRYNNHDINTNFDGVCHDIEKQFKLIEN